MTRKVSQKTFSWILIGALSLPFIFSVSLNLLLDPFQLFIKDSKQPSVFLGGRGKDRYQHAGVVRSYQPKSVIIGHSHAANFFPSKVEENLGWEGVYSLTLDGGPIYEQKRVLEFALSHSDVRHVLWLIAPYNLVAPANLTNPKLPFPEYLYDESRLNDLQLFKTLPTQLLPYSFEKRTQRQNIINDEIEYSTKIDSRDRSTEWITKTSGKFNRPVAVAKILLKAKEGEAQVLARLQKSKSLSHEVIANLEALSQKNPNFQSHLEDNIEAIISSNRNVEFSIVLLPPFPRLYWQKMKAYRPGGYQLQLSFVLTIIQKLSQYENVKFFGFGTECFTEDLRLFKDNMHYHSAINDYMLKKIGIKDNLLTAENIQKYLQDFDIIISNYRFLHDGYPKTLNSVKNTKSGLTTSQAEIIMGGCPST